jgi:hypothetical protein
MLHHAFWQMSNLWTQKRRASNEASELTKRASNKPSEQTKQASNKSSEQTIRVSN